MAPPGSDELIAVLRAISANVTAEVTHALATPSRCVPDGLVALSYINTAWLSLREMQTRRLPSCFVKLRLVSVCFGLLAGAPDGGRCVYAPPMQASSFRAGSYAGFAWAKWPLLRSALAAPAARAVLFVDADALLLRNPFDVLSLEQATRYDVRFAGELACDSSSCAPGYGSALPCQMNTGVLLMSSARLVDAVLAKMPRSLDAASRRMDRDWLDQDVADAVLHEGRYSWCPLPATQFTNLCWWSWGYNRGNRSLFDQLPRCEIVSFHTSCGTGLIGKASAIERMLQKTADCSSQQPRGGGGVLGRWGPRPPPSASTKARPKAKPTAKPTLRRGKQLDLMAHARGSV